MGGKTFDTGRLDAVRMENTMSSNLHHHGLRVKAGSYVSEASLWTKWRHSATMRYREEGCLLRIECSKFADVVQTYESVYKLIVLYAICYVSKMNEHGCTDLGIQRGTEDATIDYSSIPTSS